MELVEIGEHCMLANGCFVTDGNHRFDDPDMPITWQGFTTKGPTRIGDNIWCGANVVVTSGVTIGERCVIGANTRRHDRHPAVLDRGRRAGPRAQADPSTPAAAARRARRAALAYFVVMTSTPKTTTAPKAAASATSASAP